MDLGGGMVGTLDAYLDQNGIKTGKFLQYIYGSMSYIWRSDWIKWIVLQLSKKFFNNLW